MWCGTLLQVVRRFCGRLCGKSNVQNVETSISSFEELEELDEYGIPHKYGPLKMEDDTSFKGINELNRKTGGMAGAINPLIEINNTVEDEDDDDGFSDLVKQRLAAAQTPWKTYAHRANLYVSHEVYSD